MSDHEILAEISDWPTIEPIVTSINCLHGPGESTLQHEGKCLVADWWDALGWEGFRWDTDYVSDGMRISLPMRINTAQYDDDGMVIRPIAIGV